MENLDALKIASSKLKSQREKLNITIEEVSAELKLEKEIILSIENNNFSMFKSYLFLKGYLNNYANFLNIEVYLPELKKKKSIKFKIKKNKYKSKIKKNSLFKGILLLFFITITFLFYKTNTNLVVENNAVLEKNKSIDIGNTNLNKEKDNSSLEVEEDQSNIPIAEFNADLQQKDKLDNKTDIAISIPESNVQISDVIDEKLLEIEYNGDSWTEILDSNGDIVFFDLVKDGDTLKFNIATPFEVLLGNARVVKIKYNNDIIAVPYINPDTNVGKYKIIK